MHSIHKLLISKKTFFHLNRQMEAQETLLKLVRSFLPVPIDQHCIMAIPHQDTLVLMVESSVWASRLRYLSKDLLEHLLNQQIRFKHIQVKVTVNTKPPLQTKQHRQVRCLTPENASMLRSLAESMDYGDLKLALQRLSQHTEHE